MSCTPKQDLLFYFIFIYMLCTQKDQDKSIHIEWCRTELHELLQLVVEEKQKNKTRSFDVE